MKQPGRLRAVCGFLFVTASLHMTSFVCHESPSYSSHFFKGDYVLKPRKQHAFSFSVAHVPHASTVSRGRCCSVAFNRVSFPRSKYKPPKPLHEGSVLQRPLACIWERRGGPFNCRAKANSFLNAATEDYPFDLVESKWAKYFIDRCSEYSPDLRRDKPEYEDTESDQAKKMYILSMIPYPSGSGLHIGHCYTYTLGDVVARFFRLKLRAQMNKQREQKELSASHSEVLDSKVPDNCVQNGGSTGGLVSFEGLEHASLEAGQGLRHVKEEHFAIQQHPAQPNVLHVMGWDSFGLPAEQHSRQKGEPPEKVVRENIERFKWQLQRLGISVDWRREIATSDPRFFRWTQWTFLEMFKRGLAYEKEAIVNWCPSLGTVLANEEVTSDGLSERGHFPVVRRPMTQWHLRLRAYAKQLLEGLDFLEWPEDVLKMQREWIGFRQYAVLPFRLENSTLRLGYATIKCILMYPEEFLDARAVVVHPRNSLASKLYASSQYRRCVDAYVAASLDTATNNGMDSTGRCGKPSADFANNQAGAGVFTGLYARHPTIGVKLPVIVSRVIEDTVEFGHQIDADDVVLITPALKQALSKLEGSGLPSKTYSHDVPEFAVSDSIQELRTLPVEEARKQALTILTKTQLGTCEGRFHLRDWLFSRQRYWGEPIPVLRGRLIKNSKTLTGPSWNLLRPTKFDFPMTTAVFPLSENSLPLTLPPFRSEATTGTAAHVSNSLSEESTTPNECDRFQPTAALSRYPDWLTSVNPGEVTGNGGLENASDASSQLDLSSYFLYREPCTMPQWAGSSWYHLRFVDPFNDKFLADPKALRFWMPVDIYIGGKEHAVTHLLYARFWHKVLADTGIPCGKEPFKRLITPGVILGKPVHLLLRRMDTNEPVSADNVRLTKEPSAVAAEAFREDTCSLDSDAQSYPGVRNMQRSFLLKHNPCGIHVKSGAHVYAEVVPFGSLCQSLSSDGSWSFQRPDNVAVKVLTVSEKMSKSKGNAVAPDELLKSHGADALRLHLMTLGPVGANKTWTVDGLQGAKRFLRRVWNLCRTCTLVHTPAKCSNEGSPLRPEQSTGATSVPQEQLSEGTESTAAAARAPSVPFQLSANERKVLESVINNVTRKLELLQVNTAAAALFECLRQLQCLEKAQGFLSVSAVQTFLVLLHPFAPFITEELWERISRAYSRILRHPGHSLTASGEWPLAVSSLCDCTSSPTFKQSPTCAAGVPGESCSKDDPGRLDQDRVAVSAMFDGKRRLKLSIPRADLASAEAFRRAVEEHPLVKARLHHEREQGDLVLSVISLPQHKLVNFVFKQRDRNGAPSALAVG